MNDTATLAWYLFHGSAAFLVILIVTAIVEHVTGENR
jgi:hypothetical protein